MRGVILLCFFLALPPLAVLGHDLYMAYGEEIDLTQPFKQSDLGWLWVTYQPETYNWARGQASPETWEEYVSPVLRQKALTVTAAPALAVYPLLVVLRIIGLWPFSGSGLLARGRKVKSDFVLPGDDKKQGPYKYKRK